ncbi:oligosaccharide flippase family protein [Aeromicrobium sp. 179-A 4D2 NHS]|uniref:oligosaccharide flippase family protein n=1 Tax=Aeromicrobium sp. 179-A 4D2 NHS TaxID=3142375 RepID=UPI00399FEA3E
MGTTSDTTASVWRKVGTSAMAKVVVMGLSGVLGIITSRIIITSYGVDAYANYGLLATLPNLLPFADLGIAAVVINAIAGSGDPRRDELVRRTITSALRIMIVSGSIIALVSALLYVTGAWGSVLGEGLLEDGGELSAFLCLLVFGLVLPLTVGQRILVGLHRNTTQVAAQSVVAPFMLLVIGAAAALSVPMGAYLPVVSYLGNAIVSVICLGIAAHALRPQVGAAFRDVVRLRSVPGVPVFDLAWPMLVQMVTLPITMQTGRILLSHLGEGQDLAQYNLASQLFGLALQTIATAGMALWPHFASARSQSRVESPLAATVWFIAGGLVLAGALAAVSPWLADFISDGEIHLDLALVLAYVAFVALQASKYPVGMYMTDERGLRFQVLPTIVMIPIGLGVAWALIPAIGAAGAVAGPATAVLLCQVVPNLWYAQRDVARRRREQAAA